MQTKNIAYNPLPFQELFQQSTKPKVYMSAGYGAGKTYSLCMKILQLININKPYDGGIVCPTIKMFKRDVLPTLKEILSENGIYYKYNKSDSFFYFPTMGVTVYVFHGEDHGASIRGPNLAWMAINECSLISKPTFDAAIARVRVKGAPLRQIAMSGTPEEFNWIYEYFVEDPRADTDLIFGDMRLNFHNADDYAQMLIESYDKVMVEAYVEGKFVNLTGNRALYAFDRMKHVKPVERIEDAEVWVTMDFNVTPMSAVLWNPMPSYNRKGGWLRAFDEIKINSSNTYEFSNTLRQKLGTQRDGIAIFPDPTGKNKSTKTKDKSDFDILRQYGFDDIRAKSKLSVRDCLNAANNLLDKDAIIIDPKCKNFIADCEQVIIKPGTFDIEKKDLRRTHWLDGFKAMADYEFPVVKSRSSVYERQAR